MENASILSNVAKATRQELMDAYRALLKKYKEANVPSIQEQHSPGNILTLTNKYAGEVDIRADITVLRTNLGAALSDIEKTVLEKFGELKSFDEALIAQKAKLKELHEIEDAAGTLIALLQAREEVRKNIEREKIETDQRRKRDEEEYAFTFNFQKRKDKEAYEAEKRKIEDEFEIKQVEFERRQKELAAKEDELAVLRAQVQEFPKTLAKEKRDAEERVATMAAKDKEMALLLASKESDAVKTVLEGKIESLQTASEDYKQLIVSLQDQLKVSHIQIQEVVLKSIESAAGAKTLDAVNKLALEQTRASSGRS